MQIFKQTLKSRQMSPFGVRVSDVVFSGRFSSFTVKLYTEATSADKEAAMTLHHALIKVMNGEVWHTLQFLV